MMSRSIDNRSARTHASGKPPEPHGTSQAFIPGPRGSPRGWRGVSGWGAGGGHRDGGPGMTWCAGGRGVALEAAEGLAGGVTLPKQPEPAKAPEALPKQPEPAKAPEALPKQPGSAKAPEALPKQPWPADVLPKQPGSAKAPVALPKQPGSAKAPEALPKQPEPAKAPETLPKQLGSAKAPALPNLGQPMCRPRSPIHPRRHRRQGFMGAPQGWRGG